MGNTYDKNIQYYDRNAGSYELSSWYFFNKYKDKTLQEELNTCIGSIKKDHISVLEIGPGTGYLLSKLVNIKDVDLHYTGIEHSHGMLNILKDRYQNRLHSLEILHASVSAEYIDTNLSDKSFDLILGSSILHHLPDYDQLIPRLAHILNPGGVMYFVREPVHRNECAKVKIYQETFNYVYESINALLLKPKIKNLLWPQKVKQEDAREVAVHMFKEGVSTKPILDLCEKGFRLIIFRKYNRRASSFFSYVENKWLTWSRKDIFGNTLFSIGVQKNKSYG